jgi:uncharacterized protein
MLRSAKPHPRKFLRRILLLCLLLIAIALLASKPLAHLITEVWWFQSTGFDSVFWTMFRWQILIWLVTFLGYSLFLLLSYGLVIQRTKQSPFYFFDNDALESESNGVIHLMVGAGILLFSGICAQARVADWEVVLKSLNATAGNVTDPVLRQDVGFYLFQLPLYEALLSWLLVPLVAAFALVSATYVTKNMIVQVQQKHLQIQPSAKHHLTVLLGLMLILLGWYFWLARYHLLYGADGTVFGVGYADFHAKLWGYKVVSILAVVLAIVLILFRRRRDFRLEFRGLAVFIAAIGLFLGLYPWFLQQFIVAPNELAKEKEYLGYNIQLTQAAYKLSEVQQEKYQADAKLTNQSLQNNQPTIQNIRLWDYRPLLSTYRQLQEIRSYYRFHDADIDRYTLNGTYQQVMLSAREISHAQLPTEAKTWVNQRLKYTHGYGFAMSPVNQITSDGLPEFYVKNIPPAATVDLAIQQPAIYYGEETDSYIFTGMKTDEFDYPIGNTNASVRYQGQGGVNIPSFWHRLLYAYDRNSLQLLISNYFTANSRIHYYRQITDRVHHIAPFLQLDRDPYLVVVDGQLQWIIDAYTTSNYYPYAQPVSLSKDVGNVFSSENARSLLDFNYIRNSVKIVINAYDGSMRFFASDPSDPILQTYQRIFPSLFEPDSAVPESIRRHFRYPQDLFKVQMQMYLNYHMSDPEVFYNREDQWRLPHQIYEDADVLLDPYYVIMRLPGEKQAGFLLIQPFTPANKENMIAWVAARSNGEDYGKLLLYEFPKQSLVFGPRQIEARIDQEPQISQQFTLWNQSGSKVIRGDLLVIPIDQSLLYVEPVYLRAEQSELPELKRVIVAYDKSIVMEKTLDEALASIFGEQKAVPKATTTTPAQSAKQSSTASVSSSEKTKQVKAALDRYRKSQEALKKGDWAEYGRYQEELETILKQLEQP